MCVCWLRAIGPKIKEQKWGGVGVWLRLLSLSLFLSLWAFSFSFRGSNRNGWETMMKDSCDTTDYRICRYVSLLCLFLTDATQALHTSGNWSKRTDYPDRQACPFDLKERRRASAREPEIVHLEYRKKAADLHTLPSGIGNHIKKKAVSFFGSFLLQWSSTLSATSAFSSLSPNIVAFQQRSCSISPFFACIWHNRIRSQICLKKCTTQWSRRQA